MNDDNPKSDEYSVIRPRPPKRKSPSDSVRKLVEALELIADSHDNPENDKIASEALKQYRKENVIE